MKIKGYKWKFESKEDFQKIVNECQSIKTLIDKLGLKQSGSNHRTLKKKIKEFEKMGNKVYAVTLYDDESVKSFADVLTAFLNIPK